MTQFVGTYHAGYKMNHIFYSVILTYLHRAPIICYSEKHNAVESSTFRSDLFSLRTGLEITKGLCYKLRMTGVPIDGPTSLFCNNKLVVASNLVPQYTLAKKHLGIFHQTVRYSFSVLTHRITHIDIKF